MEIASKISNIFGSMRFLDLAPDAMRKPGFPGQTVLGDGGENLPTVLQDICADPQRKAVFNEWLRELTPMDVADLEFPSDPISGLVQLVIREADGSRISALSASDGTLRFLAMLAALLGTNPARLYFFEEIDNGIHPSRLRLLLDLIEGQTAKGGIQVVTTTHSPDLLSMIGDETFNNTSVVYRLPGKAGSNIRSVAALPDAVKLRASQGLGRLHASGWMEDALAFTESDSDEGDDK
jgi:predicted ATPase